MDRQIELTSLRTANSKTFDLGAGKKQVTVTMHRQHYMDGSELKDIDTKWESEVGFGEKVQKADYHLTYKDRTVRFGFSTGVYVEYHMPCDMVASGSELKGQISKDVSIRYLSTPDGVKMEIVLEKCPLVAPTYTIPITLSGCTLTSDMLFMADGKAVGQIPSPYMTDGKDEIGEVAISLGKGGLAITPDFKWLQGAVYPVVIDPTTTFVVGAGANDGYRGAGIYFIAYSPFGRIGYANGGTNHIYCRFPTVGIPKGYTITSAVLQEKALSSLSETDCHTAIYLNSADNAVAPTNYTTYDALSKTIAYSSWTMPSMVSGTWYDSPDFSAAVQEVINRAGWASGNALMVMHEDNGAAGHREVFLYEQNATYAPKLVIEYTEGGGGDVTISPPTASATAEGIPPTITAYRSATVSPPTATATAEGIAPTISISQSVTISVPTATATAEGIPPIITALRSVTVSPPTAEATAQGIPPTITALRSVTISPPTAEAIAEGIAPVITAYRSVTISPPTATAIAEGIPPTISAGISVTIEVPTAEATAEGIPPTVTALRSVTISPPTATAEATGTPPVVTALRSVTVSPPTAEAIAEGIPPTVTALMGVVISPPTAEAIAEGIPPVVTALRSVTISVPTATATAEAIPPSITITKGVTIIVPTAEAIAEAIPPTVTACRSVTVTPPTASATAQGVSPTITALRSVTIIVPTAEAFAEAINPTITASNPIHAIRYITYAIAERTGITAITERQGETRIESMIIGNTARITHTYISWAGEPVDVTDPTLKIYEGIVSGVPLATIPLTAAERTGTGAYQYDYTIPPGVYDLIFEFSGESEGTPAVTRKQESRAYV